MKKVGDNEYRIQIVLKDSIIKWINFVFTDTIPFYGCYRFFKKVSLYRIREIIEIRRRLTGLSEPGSVMRDLVNCPAGSGRRSRFRV